MEKDRLRGYLGVSRAHKRATKRQLKDKKLIVGGWEGEAAFYGSQRVNPINVKKL